MESGFIFLISLEQTLPWWLDLQKAELEPMLGGGIESGRGSIVLSRGVAFLVAGI